MVCSVSEQSQSRTYVDNHAQAPSRAQMRLSAEVSADQLFCLLVSEEVVASVHLMYQQVRCPVGLKMGKPGDLSLAHSQSGGMLLCAGVLMCVYVYMYVYILASQEASLNPWTASVTFALIDTMRLEHCSTRWRKILPTCFHDACSGKINSSLFSVQKQSRLKLP